VAYEWDDEKNRTNRRKHGVDFADAVSALEDDEALTMDDDDSDEEDRFVTLGMDSLGRLLVVVHTWRGENIRMISAVKPLAGKGRRTRANDEKAIRFFES
jgi:uncharacterized DUF497 family protein